MVGGALARAEEAPGRGHHWGSEAHHPTLIRGHRVPVGTAGPLEQILFGPSRAADGATNLVGALRHAMATTVYTDLKELQRIEVVTSRCAALRSRSVRSARAPRSPTSAAPVQPGPAAPGPARPRRSRSPCPSRPPRRPRRRRRPRTGL